MKKSFSKEKCFLKCKNVLDQSTKAVVFQTLRLSETIKLTMIMKKKSFSIISSAVFLPEVIN